MVTYLTKQFQSVPALMAIYRKIGGQFVSTRSNTIHAIKKDNPSVRISRYIEKFGSYSTGYRHLSEAQAVVTGAPYRQILSKLHGKKYMIFTGTTPSLTVKQIREDHAHFDKLCVIGPRMMRTVQQANLDIEVVPSGYFPFLSFPERKSSQSQVVLEGAGIDTSRKTVLYLPRGEPFGSFDMMMPEFAEKFAHIEMNLVVRPHPSQSVKLHLRDRIRFLLMQRNIKQNGNIFMDMNYFKLADLLAMADLVITDGNSPAEESLFYGDVPQILIETHRLSRKTISESMKKQQSSDDDIALALRIYDNGPIATPQDDILAKIYQALESADAYAKARDENYTFVFGQRDFALQQAIIEELRQFN
ncbi:MAG TPA: hypothetical protein PL131_09210 [Methylotenera sp.]|nr:hypothetical protein [Methylotenera sp.]HPH06040.1 hypothetical protein [Methylotenera sp.]HPN00618.1 hypothetical protein [Methylotenera sp.]